MTGTDWPFVIADVFTDRPLAGNQLAVFTAAERIPDQFLQPLAREMNFSESVFVYRRDVPASAARVRIFMPGAEIPFAGHPIIGAATVLALDAVGDQVRLTTGVGEITVRIERDTAGTPSFAWMTQPVPTHHVVADAAGLLAALGVARSELPITLYDNGMRHLYIALPTPGAVLGLRPDFGALAAAVHAGGLHPVGVNCFAGVGEAWTTRMFAPGEDIAEDPATGSAAGPLAVHLLRHGMMQSGQTITIAQGAAIGRPSTLLARATRDADAITEVVVGGAAVIVARGAFDGARIMR